MAGESFDEALSDVEKLDDLHKILLANIKKCNDLAIFLIFECRFGKSLGSFITSRPARHQMRVRGDDRWFGRPDAERLADVVNSHPRAEHLYHQSCNTFLTPVYTKHFGPSRLVFKGKFEASSYHQFAMLYCEVVTKLVLECLDRPRDEGEEGKLRNRFSDLRADKRTREITPEEILSGNILAFMNWHEGSRYDRTQHELCYHDDLTEIEDKLQRERAYAREKAAREGVVVSNWAPPPPPVMSVSDMWNPMINPYLSLLNPEKTGGDDGKQENGGNDVPVPVAQSPSGRVKLFGPEDCPRLDGKPVNKLSPERYEFAKYVLEVQAEFAEQGLEKGPLTGDLQTKFEGSYRGAYAFFTQDDPAWKACRLKSKKGGGFRFA